MKNRRIITFLTALCMFMIVFCLGKPKHELFPLSKVINTNDITIFGKWVSSDDSLWVLNFTSSTTCKQYYNGILKEVDSVIISNSSTQCGVSVDTADNARFMQLINKANTADVICYEIYGITDKTLTIVPIRAGGSMVFWRQ